MMDAREPVYVRLAAGETVSRLEYAEPFKAVIVIEDDVTAEWRTAVSEWLVRSGCRYAMAWGLCCSAWDDSIDLANLRTFGHGEVLDQDFGMTTWHERETLKDVFWFAMHAAMHPVLVLDQTISRRRHARRKC